MIKQTAFIDMPDEIRAGRLDHPMKDVLSVRPARLPESGLTGDRRQHTVFLAPPFETAAVGAKRTNDRRMTRVESGVVLLDLFRALLPSPSPLPGLQISLSHNSGFSDRFARDLVSGRRPFPADVRQALDDLDEDSDVLVDEIIADVQEGTGAIWVFRSNAELRRHFPDWPGRGHAGGGFVGPHRIAALAAADQLNGDGIEVDLLFFDPAR